METQQIIRYIYRNLDNYFYGMLTFGQSCMVSQIPMPQGSQGV